MPGMTITNPETTALTQPPFIALSSVNLRQLTPKKDQVIVPEQPTRTEGGVPFPEEDSSHLDCDAACKSEKVSPELFKTSW